MALTVPNVLVAGTPGVADDVNENFDAVEAYVNGLVTTTDNTTLLLGKLSNKLVDPTLLTANSATFTTIVDISGYTITFTALANRMYKLEMYCHVSSSIAGDYVKMHIRTNAGTTIGAGLLELPVVNEEQTISAVAFVTPGAGAVTYKVSGERISGTGSLMVESSATVPSILSVQDFGAD
jgi:hypothetical protein